MNISQLTPDQKRTILAKKLPGVIRLFGTKWHFKADGPWHECLCNDPLLDANAAQAMELTLLDEEFERFVEALKAIYLERTDGITSDGAYSATPPQRFDAFLSSLSEE